MALFSATVVMILIGLISEQITALMCRPIHKSAAFGSCHPTD